MPSPPPLQILTRARELLSSTLNWTTGSLRATNRDVDGNVHTRYCLLGAVCHAADPTDSDYRYPTIGDHDGTVPAIVELYEAALSLGFATPVDALYDDEPLDGTKLFERMREQVIAVNDTSADFEHACYQNVLRTLDRAILRAAGIAG